MPEKKKKDELTDPEMGRYVKAALETQEGLQHAIDLLRARRHVPELTMNERRRIDVAVGKLTVELTKVEAKLLSFRANQAAIRPPSAADLNEITTLSRELDDLTAATTKVTALVKIGTSFARAFRRTA